MATSLGKIARAEIVDVNTQLYFGSNAQTNTLPVAGAGKLTLHDSAGVNRRIELLDNTEGKNVGILRDTRYSTKVGLKSPFTKPYSVRLVRVPVRLQYKDLSARGGGGGGVAAAPPCGHQLKSAGVISPLPPCYSYPPPLLSAKPCSRL